jgi:regulator of nonsense transcripts 1
VSRAEPLNENHYKGSIVGRNDTQIKISFPSTFDVDGPWRLDLGRTAIIFERMRKAISTFHYDLDFVEKITGSADEEYVLLGTGLRDVLLRSGGSSKALPSGSPEFHALQAPDDTSYPKDVLSHDVREFSSKNFEGVFKDDMRIRSWAERYSFEDPLIVEGDPILSHLNGSQIKAMATMIGKRISLVQGVRIQTFITGPWP